LVTSQNLMISGMLSLETVWRIEENEFGCAFLDSST
jgi:hypothetical protein